MNDVISIEKVVYDRAFTQNTTFKKKNPQSKLISKIILNLMRLCYIDCHIIKS